MFSLKDTSDGSTIVTGDLSVCGLDCKQIIEWSAAMCRHLPQHPEFTIEFKDVTASEIEHYGLPEFIMLNPQTFALTFQFIWKGYGQFDAHVGKFLKYVSGESENLDTNFKNKLSVIWSYAEYNIQTHAAVYGVHRTELNSSHNLSNSIQNGVRDPIKGIITESKIKEILDI